jgi:hypothetical protein
MASLSVIDLLLLRDSRREFITSTRGWTATMVFNGRRSRLARDARFVTSRMESGVFVIATGNIEDTGEKDNDEDVKFLFPSEGEQDFGASIAQWGDRR